MLTLEEVPVGPGSPPDVLRTVVYGCISHPIEMNRKLPNYFNKAESRFGPIEEWITEINRTVMANLYSINFNASILYMSTFGSNSGLRIAPVMFIL